LNGRTSNRSTCSARWKNSKHAVQTAPRRPATATECGGQTGHSGYHRDNRSGDPDPQDDGIGLVGHAVGRDATDHAVGDGHTR